MKHGIKQKQSEFERNAKKILGFERFWSKIREIEKKLRLNQLQGKNGRFHTVKKIPN